MDADTVVCVLVIWVLVLVVIKKNMKKGEKISSVVQYNFPSPRLKVDDPTERENN